MKKVVAWNTIVVVVFASFVVALTCWLVFRPSIGHHQLIGTTDQDTITNLPSNSGPLLNFWGGDRPFSEHSLLRIHKAFRREQERTTQLRVQQTTKYTHPTAVQCRCVVWCPHAHSQSHAMVTGWSISGKSEITDSKLCDEEWVEEEEVCSRLHVWFPGEEGTAR